GSGGLVNIESSAVFSPADDENELAMRVRAMAMANRSLEEEIPNAVGLVGHHFGGRLERRFRRAGAEDRSGLVTKGNTVPARASGVTLEGSFSVSIALEYRGHWVRASRVQGEVNEPTRRVFEEQLDGSYPYESGSGKIVARHCEYDRNGKRIFYGDTIL